MDDIDARRLIREVLAQIRAESPEAEAPSPTLGEFFPRFIEDYVKANRQKPRSARSKESCYRIHWEKRLGDRPMNLIVDSDIQAFKAAAAGGSAKTANNALSTLNKCLKIAVRWHVLKQLPVTIEMLPYESPEVGFYEFEQYDSLVRYAEHGDLRGLVAVLLGGDAGLRMGEMVALEWGDCDFRREALCIRRSESQGHLTETKSRKIRFVPMTSKLFEALTALRTTTRGARVFARDDGTNVSEQTLRTWIGWVQKRAGMRVGQLHILRHTFCSHLAMRGAASLAIKKLAGHSSLRTTERYMHLAPAEGERAIGLLDAARQSSGNQTSLPVAVMSPAGFELDVHRRTYRTRSVSEQESREAVSRDDDVALWRAALAQTQRREGNPLAGVRKDSPNQRSCRCSPTRHKK